MKKLKADKERIKKIKHNFNKAIDGAHWTQWEMPKEDLDWLIYRATVLTDAFEEAEKMGYSLTERLVKKVYEEE